MAHSFVEAFDDETAAFAAFAQSRPDNLVFLIDTYDTEAAAHKVVALAPRLKAKGITIRGVRLDSGDLAAMSRKVRRILDAGGLNDVTIFASGGLDEDRLAALTKDAAPIDGFGVGTSLTTSSDVPTLDCVYKLQEYAGLPRRKRSEKKATWPGRKQVWRRYGADGRMAGDLVAHDGDNRDGEPLIGLVMRDGRRIKPAPTLDEIRQRAKEHLERVPEGLRMVLPAEIYPVKVAGELDALAADVDRRIKERA
jgi:nicotinate phosphoribosyltransferase